MIIFITFCNNNFFLFNYVFYWLFRYVFYYFLINFNMMYIDIILTVIVNHILKYNALTFHYIFVEKREVWDPFTAKSGTAFQRKKIRERVTMCVCCCKLHLDEILRTAVRYQNPRGCCMPFTADYTNTNGANRS